ncbi:hypothetical protein PX418_001710, partial [Campylobacter coli]|nr:hypothetical protein [Campylobacter coli]
MEKDKIKFHNNISIVFAVDENYLPYTSVALASLIEKSVEYYIYDIYIIHSNINLNILLKLKKVAQARKNIIINFINIKSYLEDAIKQYDNI